MKIENEVTRRVILCDDKITRLEYCFYFKSSGDKLTFNRVRMTYFGITVEEDLELNWYRVSDAISAYKELIDPENKIDWNGRGE